MIAKLAISRCTIKANAFILYVYWRSLNHRHAVSVTKAKVAKFVNITKSHPPSFHFSQIQFFRRSPDEKMDFEPRRSGLPLRADGLQARQPRRINADFLVNYYKGYLWKTTALILLQQAPTGASSAEFNIMRKFLRSFCGESAFSPTRHSRNEAFCACAILLSLRVTTNKKYELSILDE